MFSGVMGARQLGHTVLWSSQPEMQISWKECFTLHGITMTVVFRLKDSMHMMQESKSLSLVGDHFVLNKFLIMFFFASFSAWIRLRSIIASYAR